MEWTGKQHFRKTLPTLSGNRGGGEEGVLMANRDEGKGNEHRAALIRQISWIKQKTKMGDKDYID